MQYKGICLLLKQYHMAFYGSKVADTHSNHKTFVMVNTNTT